MLYKWLRCARNTLIPFPIMPMLLASMTVLHLVTDWSLEGDLPEGSAELLAAIQRPTAVFAQVVPQSSSSDHTHQSPRVGHIGLIQAQHAEQQIHLAQMHAIHHLIGTGIDGHRKMQRSPDFCKSLARGRLSHRGDGPSAIAHQDELHSLRIHGQ